MKKMETKKLNNLKVILLVKLLFFFNVIWGQEYFMTDIKIDTIKMSDAHFNYSVFFECNIKEKSSYIIEEKNMVVDKFLYECDSMQILFDMDQEGRYPFTYYLENFSSKRTIYFKGKALKIGMPVEEIGLFLPKIQEEYLAYLKDEDMNFFESAYFNIPISIRTRYSNVSFYYGHLSFNVEQGKIISILIDFRADGDLDD
jgi:hypothetical protein